jgi:hypothetical protein
VCGLSEDRLPELVARLSQDEPLDTRSRGRLIGRLAALLAGSAKRAGTAAVASGRWLTDVVVEVAPHVPVRDADALRAQFPGQSGEAVAESLVAAAAKATAAVGAAGGAVAAVEFAAPPALLTAPVLVSAETLAVVAIELKLVAELHEIYGVRPPGTAAQRAMAFAVSWARQRGVDLGGGAPVTEVLGSATKRELRQRLVRRAGRNVSTILPFLAGALAGAEFNRRETRKLGEKINQDLHGRL